MDGNKSPLFPYIFENALAGESGRGGGNIIPRNGKWGEIYAGMGKWGFRSTKEEGEGHINFLGHAWVSPNTGEKGEMAHSLIITCERIQSFHV